MTRPARRGKKAFSLFFLTVVAIGLFAYYEQRPHEPSASIAGDPILTGQRQVHILQGDETGGGHMFGAGKPCKSEFPSTWNADKILQTVKNVAANDNLPWKQESNGYFVAETRVDGVRVRVVLNDDRTKIITGYPLNMPRNPCPPANDNFNR